MWTKINPAQIRDKCKDGKALSGSTLKCCEFNDQLSDYKLFNKTCVFYTYTSRIQRLLLAEYYCNISEINREVSGAPAYAFISDVFTVEIPCRGTKREDHQGLDEII